MVNWPPLFLLIAGLVIIGIVAAVLHKYYQMWRIHLWMRSLKLQKHSPYFSHVFYKVNGFQLSKKARASCDVTDYIYGEIEFIPFVALLALTKPISIDIFYDLGSGTGKAVIACAMVFPIQKALGIELLEPLHQSACIQKEKLIQIKEYSYLTSKIEFDLGNFLDLDLTEATIIFINSTTLFQPTWGALCARLDTLPHLKTVITTSKPLISNRFKVERSTTVEMSWGIVDAYIHRIKPYFN